MNEPSMRKAIEKAMLLVERNAKSESLVAIAEMQAKLEQRFGDMQQGIEKRLGEMSQTSIERVRTHPAQASPGDQHEQNQPCPD